MAMTDEEAIALVNRHRPDCLELLNGEMVQADSAAGTAEMRFELDRRFAHTDGTVVQGGFVTAMLDAVMGHALFIQLGLQYATPTLEIHVSFLEAARPGAFRATGRVVRRGRSISFLEADLFDADDRLVARGTSTVKQYPFRR